MGRGARTWLGLLVLAAVALLVWLFASSDDDAGSPAGDDAVVAQDDSTPSLRGAPGAQPTTSGPQPNDGREPAADAQIPPFRFLVTTLEDEPLGGVVLERLLGASETELGRTDAQGSLEVVIPPEGIHAARVVASKDGRVPTHHQANRGQLNVIRMPAGTDVTGLVVRAEDDTPIEGATVRAFRANDREELCRAATTDARGGFTLKGLPHGTRLFIVARTEGWHAAGVARTFPDDEPVVVRIGGGCTLRGVVTDAEGNPKEGVTVWLMRPDRAIPPRAMPRQWSMAPELSRFFYPQVKTDRDGQYEIRGIQPNEERVPIAWLSEHAEVTGESVTFAKDGEEAARDIQVPALATLVYRVLDADGNALRDVQFDMESPRVWFSARQVVPDEAITEDGWRTIEGLVPGTWKTRAWIPNTDDVEKTLELRAGETTRVTYEPPKGLRLEGTVLDPEGRPLRGCDVSWWDGTKGMRGETDDEGEFRFIGLPDTAGTLRVDPGFMDPWRDGGAELESTRIEGVRGGGDPLRIVLERAGRVRGILVGVAAGTQLECRSLSQRSSGRFSITVGEGGHFELKAEPTGTPSILVIGHPEHASRILEVPARERGKDIDLGRITFDKGIVLEGVVRGADGRPVSRATVRLTERWLDRTTTTAEDGRYRFSRLPRRPVWMRVDAPAHPPHFLIAQTKADVTTFDIALTKGGTLEGTVVDVDGKPIAGCSIMFSWDVTSPYDADLDHLRLHYGLRDDGRFALRMQPGRYKVRVYGPKYAWHQETTVEIEAGRTTALPLDPRKR